MCFFAVAKNLVTYLTTVLHESNVDAARNVSTWIGSCFLTPVIGAFLADSYWGRYTTIAVFLSVYIIVSETTFLNLLYNGVRHFCKFSLTMCNISEKLSLCQGMLIMTSSAALPFFLPRSSDESGGVHPAAVYLGLYLVALGTGGIKPYAAALGADQFDGADPKERVAKGSFFNWYYFSINIGSLLASTLLVWVQDNIGWTVGFGIPTVLIGFGLAVFVAGGRIYRYKPLGRGGSPLARVFQVVVAATRNCRLELPDDSSALHENDRGEHTSQFTFFDKAAIVLPSSEKKGPWRLCTVSQVEELKTLLRMSPVWASLLIFFAVTGQMSSTLIEQGMAMDKRVGAFVVSPASLSTFDVISVLVWVPIYDAVLVPLARRVTGEDRGFTQLQRIGVGLALSAAGMAYAALIETRRLAAPASSMSIMWQAPCYFVLGAAEVFTSIGMLEFFYDQFPGSMKSLGSALALLAIAGGNYLNSVLLGAVASTTGWIADNLDQGHLDYFFWFMAGLSVLNLLQFVYCSTRYKSIDQL
ncbi:unnamed protein product [Triticum turgidum subsp. durum]|uniref:Peptide transporter PTR2 n=1 Tax=Triticum turgidum subsp. durum TaxID=4567 RepID=A0A9R1A5R5_TRITD|nr:unnamed protein product [Triticum turgidum subsp. durum]